MDTKMEEYKNALEEHEFNNRWKYPSMPGFESEENRRITRSSGKTPRRSMMSPASEHVAPSLMSTSHDQDNG